MSRTLAEALREVTEDEFKESEENEEDSKSVVEKVSGYTESEVREFAVESCVDEITSEDEVSDVVYTVAAKNNLLYCQNELHEEVVKILEDIS